VSLALLGVASVSVQAVDSYHQSPPNEVLMKGPTVLQKERMGSSCWNYYNSKEEGGGWASLCADTGYTFPRRAVLLEVGSRPHLRINKPQRPERVRIVAYKDFDRNKARPIGEGHRLDITLRRVEREGETVAWDVYLGVNRPDHHYYLDTWIVWERVPGTRTSSGDLPRSFHLNTR
jgi:hypothetical protein